MDTSQNNMPPHTRSFEASITHFECPEPSGGFHIDAAVASYELKGEDKFAFVTTTNEPLLSEHQTEVLSTRLVAFMGIFDGHDGPAAADYCAEGLLHHVLAETIDCADKAEKSARKGTEKKEEDLQQDLDRSILKEGHISGFQRAHNRFGSYSDPPTFRELEQGVKKVRTNKTFLERWLCTGQRHIHGGTTACTLALYARYNGNETTPLHSAVIANTGDSRCITDDGTGSATFRQISKDHRPFKADEYRRLKPYVNSGNTFLEKDVPGGTLRLYPGGLAVSRTIGDTSLADAAIPTPEVFFSPLTFTKEKTKYRFIIASDGLWDVFDNDTVGKLATNRRGYENSSDQSAMGDCPVLEPKEAAKQLIDSCIKHGGYDDDVTVMIVDVSLADKSRQA